MTRLIRWYKHNEEYVGRRWYEIIYIRVRTNGRGLSDGAQANHLRNVYPYRTRTYGRPEPKITHWSIVVTGQIFVFTANYMNRLYMHHLSANFCRIVHFDFIVFRLSAKTYFNPRKWTICLFFNFTLFFVGYYQPRLNALYSLFFDL